MNYAFIIEPKNHRMVWFRRDLKDQLVPIPLPWAERPSTRLGGSKPQLAIEHFQG